MGAASILPQVVEVERVSDHLHGLGGHYSHSLRSCLDCFAHDVVDDPELRARLSRVAGEASRRYDIGECVRRMEDLYDDVLRGRPRA
jgi:hypothetical protein